MTIPLEDAMVLLYQVYVALHKLNTDNNFSNLDCLVYDFKLGVPWEILHFLSKGTIAEKKIRRRLK